MEVNLENIEKRLIEVIEDVVGGEKSKVVWASVQNLLRREKEKLTGEIRYGFAGLRGRYVQRYDENPRR